MTGGEAVLRPQHFLGRRRLHRLYGRGVLPDDWTGRVLHGEGLLRQKEQGQGMDCVFCSVRIFGDN